MGMGGIPAGWYDDGRGTMRWWDGERWTEVIAPPDHDAPTRPSGSEHDDARVQPGSEPSHLTSPAPGAVPGSRLGWIVGGTVVLTVGVAAVIFAVGVLPGIAERMDASADAGESGADPGGPSPPSAAPTVDDAAIDAIAMLDSAWVERDCDRYFASTTAHFRDYTTTRTCQDFEPRAEERGRVILSNVWVVTMSEQPNAIAATVITHNVTESLVDADGKRVEQPVLIETDYAYHLEKQGGEWKVDEVHEVGDGRAEWAVTADEEAAARSAADAWVVALTTGDCSAAQAAMTLDFAARNGFASEDGWGECAGLEQHVRERAAVCEFSVQASDVVYNSRVDPHLGEILVTTVERCGDDQIVELHMVDVGDAGWRVSDVLYGTTER